MNGKIFLFLILFLTARLFAQQGFSSGNNPHDSLLSEGSGIINYFDGSCVPDTNCSITVWSVTGKATGTVVWWTMEPDACGPELVKVWHCEKKQLMIGQKLMPGEEITTGSDGAVELRVKVNNAFYFRTSNSVEGIAKTDRIIMGSSSTLSPSCPTMLKQGRMWLHEETDEAEKNVKEKIDNTIESVKSKIKPKGTELTIEAGDNEDIIKVYDGSADVQLKKYDDSDMKNSSDAMKQLYDDYQSGKISQEEMMKRTKEITDNFKKGANDFKMSVTVDAGFQVSAGGKLSEVTPIPADDIRWWEK